MAHFPLPIGLPDMLRQFAAAIGDAGRLLPERSRSEVGALALHRAKVEIAFELSSQARHEGGVIGVGARTFLFGPAAETGSNEQTALNTGRIELEIVAVIDAEPRKDRPKPPPVDKPDGAADRRETERLRLALDRMATALPDLPIPDDERRKLRKLLEMAAAAHAAGNLAAVRDIVAQLAPGFEALGGGPR